MTVVAGGGNGGGDGGVGTMVLSGLAQACVMFEKKMFLLRLPVVLPRFAQGFPNLMSFLFLTSFSNFTSCGMQSTIKEVLYLYTQYYFFL